MPADALPILAVCFLIVGALYASVGHAGASGYLAVMALLSVAPEVMRPTALAINVLVATIAFVQFVRAGPVERVEFGAQCLGEGLAGSGDDTPGPGGRELGEDAIDPVQRGPAHQAECCQHARHLP